MSNNTTTAHQYLVFLNFFSMAVVEFLNVHAVLHQYLFAVFVEQGLLLDGALLLFVLCKTRYINGTVVEYSVWLKIEHLPNELV